MTPNTNQILDVETADLGAVPVTRKINNQTLDKDINITVTDLGAATKKQGEKADTALQGIKVNGETIPVSSDGVVEITISDTSNAVLGIKGNGSMIPKDKNNVVNITPHIIGAVPVTRTLNGKPLADDITITPGSLGGATAAQGEKADLAIQGILGNGSIISPDGNKIVSVTPAAIGAATSGQGAKADSAIQGVKLNGNLLTPDDQKIVNVVSNSSAVYTAQMIPGWTQLSLNGGYMETFMVKGMLETDTPIVDLIQSSDIETAKNELEAWSLVSKITALDDFVSVYCYGEAPDIELNLRFLCIR